MCIRDSNEVAIASLGGAIPSNLAKSVSLELAEKGYIERSWTGLECQPFIQDTKPGVLISGVIDGSPAMVSGFLPGDLVTQVDGKKVLAKIREDLPLFHQIISLPFLRREKLVSPVFEMKSR